MAELRTSFLVIFLMACSIWDIRFRRLPLWLLIMGILVGTILEILENGPGMGMLWNVVPGLILFSVSLTVPKQLGTGDGCMLMGAGALAGWEMSLLLLEGGLFFLFPAAFFWAFVRKKRRQELPFAPFLLAACLGSLVFL